MLVRIDNVSRRYGLRWALASLSAEFAAGDVVLLTGDNGAGKTTLLKILATLLKPTRGKLTLFGRDAFANLDAVRPRVAILTHQTQLYDDLSARENLALHARLSGADPKRIDPMLERVGMAAAADRPVRTYSAGMKRRTSLAKLVLKDPELVLLDEPFTQLDPPGVALMESVIRELGTPQRVIVVSTHDVERGAALANRRLHLSLGRAQAEGQA